MGAAIDRFFTLGVAGLLGSSVNAYAMTACPEDTSERPFIAWAILAALVAVASVAATLIARWGLRASTTGLKIAGVAAGVGSWVSIVGVGAVTFLYLLFTCF
jgi:hypothetical protein